jgi:plastocyanin
MSHRKKTVGIVIIAVILGLAALYGAIVATSAYLDSQYESLHQGCSPRHANHEVTIQNGKIEPSNTVASKCDTLTIKNLDSVDRIMAFGVHDHHVAYDGVEERELLGNQSFTVTLIQPGSFKFHDHMHDEVAGTFQVQ